MSSQSWLSIQSQPIYAVILVGHSWYLTSDYHKLPNQPALSTIWDNIGPERLCLLSLFGAAVTASKLLVELSSGWVRRILNPLMTLRAKRPTTLPIVQMIPFSEMNFYVTKLHQVIQFYLQLLKKDHWLLLLYLSCFWIYSVDLAMVDLGENFDRYQLV